MKIETTLESCRDFATTAFDRDLKAAFESLDWSLPMGPDFFRGFVVGFTRQFCQRTYGVTQIEKGECRAWEERGQKLLRQLAEGM
jgi:hypothetical protein